MPIDLHPLKKKKDDKPPTLLRNARASSDLEEKGMDYEFADKEWTKEELARLNRGMLYFVGAITAVSIQWGVCSTSHLLCAPGAKLAVHLLEKVPPFPRPLKSFRPGHTQKPSYYDFSY